jgi:hypothetical protein
VLGKGPRADDVALALSVGSDAIDVGRIDVALETLTWAKHEATRVGVVREALGVARYLDEDYAGALTELQAYRRISGRVDQNHLIADSLRALDRGTDRIIEPLEELLADDRVAEDRRAEAVIIWAATLADEGDLDGARAMLRRHLARPGGAEAAAHDLRVRVLAADLADRAGDGAEARRHRDVIAQAEPELMELADLEPDEAAQPAASGEPDALAGPDAVTAKAAEPETPGARDEPEHPEGVGPFEEVSLPGEAAADDHAPRHAAPRTGEQDELPFET